MKCINPHCDRTARTRGLCNACHAEACRLCAAGKTTFEELERNGRLLPKATGNSNPSTVNRLSWLREKPPKFRMTVDEAIEKLKNQKVAPAFSGSSPAAFDVSIEEAVRTLLSVKESGGCIEYGLSDDGEIVFGDGFGGLIKG